MDQVDQMDPDSPNYLNAFSSGLDALDMTALDEFESLLMSARELGIPHSPKVQYRSHNTVVRNQRFHFLEWGDASAPAILVLHGGNQSAHSWDLVNLHLADRYHVFALDQRGHGDSEWNRAADYSIDAMSRDAEAFLEAQQIEKPVIFGHSMGGMVTMSLALRRPELARAIGIVDVGPELSQAGTQIIGEFVHKNVEFDDLEEFLDRVEKYDPYRTRAHMERTLKYNLLRRADGRYVSKTDRRRFWPAGEEARSRLRGAPSLDELARLDLEVMIVRGAESQVLLAEAAAEFATALPHGQLVTVPHCGHNVHSQNTLGFLDAINPFLEAVHGR
jgi:pimeloyl-ACP methyl ester carboxylesterase